MTEHKNIHMALAAAQAEMGGVKKGSVNPAFKSKYADLSDVVQAVSGALNTAGIAFYHVPATADGERVMRTVLAHGASDTRIECDVPLIVTKNDMQGYKSASTYAKRIGLESLTGVAPADDDGNDAARAAPRRAPTVSVSPLDANGKTNSEIKKAHAELARQINACNSVDALREWSAENRAEVEDLPEDIANDLRGMWSMRREELKAVEA